jgi:hypothetical protein
MKKALLSTLLIVITSAVFAQIPKDSLKVTYLFNGNTDDASGNNKNATINGSGITLTTDRSNNSNSAYYFDGSGGTIEANIGQFADEVSVSFWYRADAQPEPYPHFFDYGDYRLRCHIMSGSIYNATDRNGIYVESYNPSATEIRGGQKPGEDKWTHIVVTFSKSANELKLYVDGSLDKQKSVASNDLDLNDGIIVFGRVRSGAASQTNLTRFKGKLDDIFIYNKILTQTEINALNNGDNVASTEEVDSEKAKFSVYPNPTSTSLNISTTLKENTTYTLTDVTGKTISQGKVTSSIDISTFTNGFYLLYLYSNGQLVGTEKVLKQ